LEVEVEVEVEVDVAGVAELVDVTAAWELAAAAAAACWAAA
jgi:hypothetical protein